MVIVDARDLPFDSVLTRNDYLTKYNLFDSRICSLGSHSRKVLIKMSVL